MTVLVEPFASVYDDGSRLGVILVRGRSGFEAYAADDHSLGLFPSPRKAAAAITTTRPWVAVPDKLLVAADEAIGALPKPLARAARRGAPISRRRVRAGS